MGDAMADDDYAIPRRLAAGGDARLGPQHGTRPVCGHGEDRIGVEVILGEGSDEGVEDRLGCAVLDLHKLPELRCGDAVLEETKVDNQRALEAACGGLVAHEPKGGAALCERKPSISYGVGECHGELTVHPRNTDRHSMSGSTAGEGQELNAGSQGSMFRACYCAAI